jgi:hypothetical protein
MRLAYVVQYAQHAAEESGPGEFKQLVVVSTDDKGEAGQDVLADARTVVTFATGKPTDAVSFRSMPQAEQIVDPLLALDANRPTLHYANGAIV